jgi:ABC-type multidrug transport system fused ATPase/permease subunit
MKKITIIKKITSLLTHEHKKKVSILLLLTLVGVFFEMLGITMFIPLIAVIISPEKFANNNVIHKVISMTGYSSQNNMIMIVILSIIIIFILKTLYLSFLYKIQNRFANTFVYELSINLFTGYLRQPYQFHVENNSSNLIKNIQGNISNLSNVTQAIINLVVEASILIGIVFIIIFSTPIGGLIVFTCLFILMYIFNHLNKKKLIFWGERKQVLGGELIKNLQESFAGVKDVLILNKQDYFIDKYKKNYKEFSSILTNINILNLLPRLYLELFAILGLCSLVIILLYFGDKTTIVPLLGLFVAGVFRIIPSANRIITSLQVIRFSSPVIDVLYNEFNTINKNIVINKGSFLKAFFNNSISIEKINFNYGKNHDFSLSDINLNIKKGTTIGILGPSGSGKSTLIDIIIGLYPISQGSVLLDGVNIDSCIQNYQNLIGYVPQNIFMMDDSLKKNIAFGISDDNISDEQIQKVIKLAKIDEFINELDEGLNTIIGERGIRLSGGQRQRIGIARALYHNPQLLVLDEATSALDNKTESEIMNSVYSFQGDKTIIIVAHRHSTVEKCDKLYYLRNGKIIDSGMPSEILTKYK